MEFNLMIQLRNGEVIELGNLYKVKVKPNNDEEIIELKCEQDFGIHIYDESKYVFYGEDNICLAGKDILYVKIIKLPPF